MTKQAKPEPELRIYTLEAAAEALEVEPGDLRELCLAKLVTHSDLGSGEDYDGHHQDHLIRFTGPMLDEARAQLAEL